MSNQAYVGETFVYRNKGRIYLTEVMTEPERDKCICLRVVIVKVNKANRTLKVNVNSHYPVETKQLDKWLDDELPRIEEDAEIIERSFDLIRKMIAIIPYGEKKQGEFSSINGVLSINL